MATDAKVTIDQDSQLGGAHSVGLVKTQTWTFDDSPLQLDCGRSLSPVTQAYEIYGTLSPERDNAILIFHALSGDAHVAGYHTPEDSKPGWWDLMVGPGKPFDTSKYSVICANVIGGCKGSTGPASVDPQTGKPYALDFPMVTIGDMVQAQKRLIDHLGIKRLLAVARGDDHNRSQVLVRDLFLCLFNVCILEHDRADGLGCVEQGQEVGAEYTLAVLIDEAYRQARVLGTSASKDKGKEQRESDGHEQEEDGCFPVDDQLAKIF